ncbi:MAG: MvdC/MvdD family ATP grasp protein [Pseudonocardiaceae bacterium]
MVLVIGDHDDWSGEAVATELMRLGARVVRLDTADFPQHARLAARFSDGWEGLLTMRSARLELGEVTAVYYREPRMFDMPAGMSEPERRFARAQARAGVGGILASLPVKWINHPSALADAIRRYLAVAGLTFGAFDFLAAAGSEALFFLECNGSGQWGWLAEACDLPIARALAEELIGGH